LGCWLLANGLALADDEVDGWEHQRTEYRHLLADGHSVSINNSFGDIRVRNVPDREVWVIAHVQRKKGESGLAQISLTEKDDRLTVDVVFPEGETDKAGGGKSHRADISVMVPKGAKIEITGRKGLIEGKELESDVHAETQFGDITLSTSGTIFAKCRQGQIRAIFESTQWSTPPRLENIHGEIAVFLPENADVTVDAATSGTITTDYTITIKNVPGKKAKTGQIVVGDGQASLVLDSTYGDIKIRRH
jgi:hypothetical protein